MRVFITLRVFAMNITPVGDLATDVTGGCSIINKVKGRPGEVFSPPKCDK
jgi:hypothetical protein